MVKTLHKDKLQWMLGHFMEEGWRMPVPFCVHCFNQCERVVVCV